MTVHILKSIRDEVRRTLTAASLQIDVAGDLTNVLDLKNPPSGSSIDEADLPAFFVFVEGETITAGSYKSYHRAVRLVVYMFAKSGSDPLDQLDEMQLNIELALEANKSLGGICFEFMPVASAVQQDQGRVVFSGRSLEYRCVTSVTSQSPTI